MHGLSMKEETPAKLSKDGKQWLCPFCKRAIAHNSALNDEAILMLDDYELSASGTYVLQNQRAVRGQARHERDEYITRAIQLRKPLVSHTEIVKVADIGPRGIIVECGNKNCREISRRVKISP
jgi:hypothetical protein